MPKPLPQNTQISTNQRVTEEDLVDDVDPAVLGAPRVPQAQAQQLPLQQIGRALAADRIARHVQADQRPADQPVPEVTELAAPQVQRLQPRQWLQQPVQLRLAGSTAQRVVGQIEDSNLRRQPLQFVQAVRVDVATLEMELAELVQSGQSSVQKIALVEEGRGTGEIEVLEVLLVAQTGEQGLEVRGDGLRAGQPEGRGVVAGAQGFQHRVRDVYVGRQGESVALKLIVWTTIATNDLWETKWKQ